MNVGVGCCTTGRRNTHGTEVRELLYPWHPWSDRLCPACARPAAKDPVLARIGEKHSATAAQIAIAWLLDQEDVIAIHKAARPSSQRANLDALNIHLDEEDRAAIAALPKNLRYVDPPFAPDWEAATI